MIEQHDGQTVIAFGNVSGKGAAAALYGALVSGLVRLIALRRRRPAELLKALNDALGERKVDARYVTLCVLFWAPATRQLVMANAGAIPPMICHGGEVLNVRVEGVPLGLLEDREYEEASYQAHPGDDIVLYSDGITDHQTANGVEYGRGRLTSVVRNHHHKSSRELMSAIFKDLDKYSTTLFDNQTVFVMKVK